MTGAEQIEGLLMQEEMALYEPSPKVLQKLGEVTLYAIVAPYGSGKDSVIEWLITHRPHMFAMVVGDASRERRPGEKQGREHHFRTKAAMIDDLHHGRFVQVVPGFAGNFYATRPEQYATEEINLKPIQARAMPVFENLGFKKLVWLQIVPHSYEAWEQWRSARTYTPEDQAERDEEALDSYVRALTNPNARFILNDEVERAAGRIIRLAEGRQISDEVRAKQTAAKIMTRHKQFMNARK